MSDWAIILDNVGKQYRIRHETEGQRYVALRDVIVDRATRFLRNSPAARRPAEDFWALKNVSFEVRQGEVVGVIGRNGAGKSTLLKLLSRITKPTSGRIRLKGRVASLLEVGTGFHPELTGRENIFLNGAILGMTRAEIRGKFDEIVDFAEISTFLDTPIKRYSNGMYVRLAFAVAAHLEPEILLVDEVLAVGDTAFQRKCMGKMGQVARHGRTILFVSHNMGAIETLTHRAVVLEHGQVAFQGSTVDAVRSYVMFNSEHVEIDVGTMARAGSGRLRLRRVYAVDEAGEPTNSVASGGPLTVVFEYDGDTARLYENVSFGISLHDAAGQTIAIHYTDYEAEPFSTLSAPGAVAFRLNTLPLKTGRYHIGARVVVNGIEADWPRGHVGYFDVELGDFYGTGRTFHSGIATFLLRGEWSVHKPNIL
jgi:lipopolysaccharide transport system ATP-binding protein